MTPDMTYTRVETKVTRVTDVYGEIPTVPANYRVIDFRPPKVGECFVTVFTDRRIEEAEFDFGNKAPRLILQMEANARLMQRAPALLTVLEDLVDHIAGDQHDEGEIDSAFGLPGLGYRISAARAALDVVRKEGTGE